MFMIAPTPFFSERGCHVRILDAYLRACETHDVTLFTYGLGRTPDLVKKVVRVWNFPWYKKTDPGPSVEKIIYDFFLFVAIAWYAIRQRPQVFYAHLHEGALLAYPLARMLRGKIIFDNQGLLVGELAHTKLVRGLFAWLPRILRGIERRLLQSVDETIVSSPGLQQSIKIQYGLMTRVVADVPNPSIFNPQVPKASLQLPQKETKGKTIVVYLGGLQPGKGVDTLLTYIPQLPRQFYFLLMGYPIEHCQAIAKRLGIQDRVHFTGAIPYEQSPGYLKLGDIAISPKQLESGEANAKLYTYRAVGLRTLCYDTPENRAILGDLGIYVRENSLAAWKQAFALAATVSSPRSPVVQLKSSSRKQKKKVLR